MSAESLHVVFKVAGSEYVLPASTVSQMESYLGATRVPGTAPFVVGIVHLRGKVVPIVDLRTRFGLPPAEITIDSRIVVAQQRERTVGLLVDSAREVVDIPDGSMRPPPPLMSDQAAGFVRAVAQVGTRLLMLVDFAKIVGEEQLDVR